MSRTTLIALAGLVLVMAVASGAHATPIELVFVVDGSGSISSGNWGLQMDSYHDAILALIPTDGTVAIGGVQFATNASMFQPLTTVTAANIGTIADNFAAQSQFGGSTNISGGIFVAEGLFSDTATKAIIDVSTDGGWNVGVNPAGPETVAGTSRWAVLNSATVVNAIGIGVTPNFAYGPDSFNVYVQDYSGFAAALRSKIATETGGVPEPGTMALLGIGLMGIGGVVVRRRRRS